MKWMMVFLLSLPSGDKIFVAPQTTFQSQTACRIAIVDMELYLSQFPDYSITCIRVPEEKDA